MTSPAAIRATYKTARGRKILMRRAAIGSSDFVSRFETLITGRKRRAQTRASRLAQAILEHVPGGEVVFALATAEEGLASAGLMERVASRTVKSASVSDLICLRRWAVELEQQEAHRYVALALCLGKDVEEGVVHEPLTGLSRGKTTPHGEEIVSLLQTANTLSPGSALISYELGRRLVEKGEVNAGLPLLELAALKDPEESWLMTLAQVYRRPDVAKFSEALDTYEQIYRLNPKNSSAQSGVVHAGVRGPMEWSRVWRNIKGLETSRKKSPYRVPEVAAYVDLLFDEGDLFDKGDVVSFLERLGGFVDEGLHLHPQTLALVVLRLQFLGHLAAGFALRQRLARNKINSLRRSGVKNISGLRQLMQAYIYLDDAETASRLSEDSEYWAQGDHARRAAVRKLHADAELMLGNPDPYFNYSVDARKGFYLPGERKMVNLVKGQRIALVGPAATNEELGEMIDGYDVVVRPNFNPEFVAAHPRSMGSRTDIAYYSGQDMNKLIDDVETLLATSGVQIVNTRSFSFHAHHQREISWLRFCRHDWSLSFHGSPLGIQRMIYDLLQFRPKEIAIFNSDFYTGAGEFAEGYREKRSFGPGSFMNDLVVVHDLLTDFKFTQAMLRTGRVTAHGRSKKVLSRDPLDYLHDVEKAGVLS
ncbi:hypothetical protein [Nesterenkonia muleiensis]|uniref:hypothetical protein n=1 Tax=Nesterenkonia muleiensis TaxID=2282648 RepID=UPI000E71E675|nr:hypothetical protein [Nesterenkonia muleiensis]